MNREFMRPPGVRFLNMNTSRTWGLQTGVKQPFAFSNQRSANRCLTPVCGTLHVLERAETGSTKRFINPRQLTLRPDTHGGLTLHVLERAETGSTKGFINPRQLTLRPDTHGGQVQHTRTLPLQGSCLLPLSWWRIEVGGLPCSQWRRMEMTIEVTAFL